MFADVEGSGIVGYAGTDNEGTKAPIVGGQFFNVGGGETFDLTKFSIPGTKVWTEVDEGEWEWVCNYVTPKAECLRVLNTSSLANDALYTYISAEYLLDNLGDVCEEDWESTIEDYKWAIGWWKYDSTFDYKNAIKKRNPDPTPMQITGALNFPNGTAFVGNFAPGKTRRLVSNGEVATKTFAFASAGAKAPVFGNQLPVDIDLTDMSIPGTKVWTEVDEGEWEWVCNYVTPKAECLRVLNTSSLANDALYTYISAEYLLDNLGDVCEEDWESTIEDYKWAIGWWKYDSTFDYKNAIKKRNPDPTNMQVKKGDFTVNAGRGFVGNFAPGKVRQVNFPSALDVPSKK